MLTLNKYNCETLEFKTVIRYDRRFWREIRTCFSKKGESTKTVRGILLYKKPADHHFHFSARRFLERKKEKLELTFALCRSRVPPPVRSRAFPVVRINKFEDWFFELLPSSLKKSGLDTRWSTLFLYDRKTHKTTLEIPYSSPMQDKDNLLGSASISGLKFQFRDAKSGLRRIYFEAFPEAYTLRSVFSSKIRQRGNLLEESLVAADRISRIFVNPK